MFDQLFIELFVHTNLMKYDSGDYVISATVSKGGNFKLENSKYLLSWCVSLNVRAVRYVIIVQ